MTPAQTAVVRDATFRAIRKFFEENAYIEIDAPILIEANAIESQIDPLCTYIEDMEGQNQKRVFLMTSPELHMKPSFIATPVGQRARAPRPSRGPRPPPKTGA